MNAEGGVLATIKSWNWTTYDPETTKPCPVRRALSEVVNKLAYSGYSNPANTLLELLKNGDLVAVGHYHWREYDCREYYQRQEYDIIPAFRWEMLSTLMDELDKNVYEQLYPTHVELSRIGLGRTRKLIWNWRDSQFAWAVNGDDYGLEETEEFFAVSDIAIEAPQNLDQVVHEEKITSSQICKPHSGGRPPKYDWERAVAAIVFRWADEGSWQPKSQADVQRRLADWFAENGEVPADSALKPRAKWLFDDFQKRNSEGQ